MRKNVLIILITIMYALSFIAVSANDILKVEGKKEPRLEIKPETEFYVDINNGNDSNVGTIEKPFKTIEKAKSAVRDINKKMKGDILINVRGGVYRPTYAEVETSLNNPLDPNDKKTFPQRMSNLKFTPEDSGMNGFNVIYKAYKDEKVVIDGGIDVKNWELYDKSKNIYRAKVEKGMIARQFYVNDEKQIRARSDGGLIYPKQDKESHKSGLPSYVSQDTYMSNWKNIKDVEFAYRSLFTFSRVPVEKVQLDGKNLNIYMQQPGYYYATHKFGTSVGIPTWIENAYELLDTPGEWYLDKNEGNIYYIPKEGVDISESRTVLPYVDVLIDIKGMNKNNRTNNIRFSGIEFKNTNWARPSFQNGHVDSQNNNIREMTEVETYPRTTGTYDSITDSNAAIQLEYAEGIIIDNCKLYNLGNVGVRIIKSSRNNLIQANRMFNIAAGAVVIGEPGWRGPENVINYNPPDPEDLMFNNDVKYNYIHNIATEYMSATAVSFTYAVDTDISYNDIIDVPYSSIHLGYGWGEVKNVCTRDTSIKNNLIDIFMNGMFDGGAIYSLGTTGGTKEHPNVISGNFIRNQKEPKFGGLYFDESSSNWVADSNVFENTEMWSHVSIISKGNHNVNITNSYITNGYAFLNYTLGQKDVYVESPYVYPTRDFPDAAENIIDNAGLPPEYSYLREDYYKLGQVDLAINKFSIKSGETVKLKPIIRTIRGVKLNDVSKEAIVYRTENPDIATVDQDGNIKAVAQGKTNIIVEITKDGVSVNSKAEVLVDDIINDIKVDVLRGRLTKGMQTLIKTNAKTKFDNVGVLDKVEYFSENPSILNVDKQRGIVTGGNEEGSTNIIVRGYKEGKEYSKVLPFTVSNTPTGDLIDDFLFWKSSSDAFMNGSGKSLIISCYNGRGYASYPHKKFIDETFKYNINIETDKSDWPSIMLRNKDAGLRVNDKGSGGYIITIKSNVIELQRFNDGQRTVLYGDIGGFTPKFGSGIINGYIKAGTFTEIEFGAQNVSDGVRLFLKAFGQTIFDVVDTDENRIKDEGYFGLIVNKGSITISK